MTIDDGTDSASMAFVLYLIRRDRWKVWGMYEVRLGSGPRHSGRIGLVD